MTSLAAFIWPPLADYVGGIGELNYMWQPWTAVFLHGWPGMPLLPHLAGNLILLALAGAPVERHIGSRWFLLLTLMAIAMAGVIRWLTGLEFNGASAFIWAYAPLLWWLIRQGKETDKAGLLWLMWLVVPLTLGIISAINGTNLLTALLLGNVYHLSATAVGFAAIRLWQNGIINQ